MMATLAFNELLKQCGYMFYTIRLVSYASNFMAPRVYNKHEENDIDAKTEMIHYLPVFKLPTHHRPY